MRLRFRESSRHRGRGVGWVLRPLCPTARACTCQGLVSSTLGAGREDGPRQEPLGALCLRAGKEDAAPGCGLRAGTGQARHSCTALPMGTGGSPRPAQPWHVGVILTKHSPIRCVWSVSIRFWSFLHPRNSAQARRVSLEVCREAEAGRWLPSPGKETWHPPPLGQVPSCSLPLMGRGSGGQSLNWVWCPGQGRGAAATSGISHCRPADRDPQELPSCRQGWGRLKGKGGVGPRL